MSASATSPTGPVATVAEVIARMQQIEAALPPDDGVACFNRMYLDVTRQVEAVLTAGTFADPTFMSTLDVVFANRYFAAVEAAGRANAGGAAVPAAWQPLFASRADPHVFPIQFALAGMNTHINYDLPIAVVRTCAQLATAPEDGSHEADYRRVDALLDRAEQSVRQSFETGTALRLDHDLQAVLDLVGNWSVNEARDVAWVTALGLWACRDVATVEDLIMDGLGRTVAAAGRCLLLGLRPQAPAPPASATPPPSAAPPPPAPPAAPAP